MGHVDKVKNWRTTFCLSGGRCNTELRSDHKSDCVNQMLEMSPGSGKPARESTHTPLPQSFILHAYFFTPICSRLVSVVIISLAIPRAVIYPQWLVAIRPRLPNSEVRGPSHGSVPLTALLLLARWCRRYLIPHQQHKQHRRHGNMTGLR